MQTLYYKCNVFITYLNFDNFNMLIIYFIFVCVLDVYGLFVFTQGEELCGNRGNAKSFWKWSKYMDKL